MNSVWESLLTNLYFLKAYSKETIATYVPNFIDEAAYQRITGEPYVKEVS